MKGGGAVPEGGAGRDVQGGGGRGVCKDRRGNLLR